MFTTISCERKSEQKVDEVKAKVVISEADITKELDRFTKAGEMDSSIGISLTDFYKPHKNQCIWWEGKHWKKSAYELISILKHAEYFGLCSGFYSPPKLDSAENGSENILKKEIALSQQLISFGSHLKFGISTGSALYYADSGILVELFSRINTDKPLLVQLEKFEPKTILYKELKNGLSAYLDEFAISDSKVNFIYSKTDSLENIRLAKRSLFVLGFMKDTLLDFEHFKASLALFQKLHGLREDSILGRNSARLLSLSNQERFLKAALSLNQLKRDSFPETYVLVNIPGFYVEAISDEKRVVRHAIVVGKYSTPTPRLISRLSNIQLNPFWNVPYSISSKEMLPKIKSDTNYLKRNRLSLLDKTGQSLDPKSVEWKDVSADNFSYRIMQEPGWKNALGNIKFNFPNRHQVYLHDTDSRGLFGNDNRAYSHGCVRVENPVGLASTLLTLDKQAVPVDTIKALIKKGSRRAYTFTSDIQIRISYYTSMTHGDGIIQFYDDVYRLEDKAWKEKLKKYLH